MIDFKLMPAGTYNVDCAQHGSLGVAVDVGAAGRLAMAHDASAHGRDAEWTYDGQSILDSFGEPSSTSSPAAITVEQKHGRLSRKPPSAQVRLI